jgi:hypothetical protein
MSAFSAQATDYFVCSNGSDSNDGLSHASAWRSYSKARSAFSTLNGGDSILFCKGEVFASSGGNWDNRNSTRDNRVTISSYTPPGSSDLTNPVLDGGGIQFSNGGNAEHKEGFIVRDLVLKGSGSGYGIFIYNDSDFVSVINVEIFNFDIGIHFAGSNSPNPGSDGKNSDLKVQGVYIHDNGDQGFLGGGDNLLIENSAFVNNGWLKPILNHNIYVGKSSINSIIRGNWLYQSAMVGGKCSGTSFVVHGVHTNMRIEDNVVWEDPGAVEDGCWGISVDNGYGGQYEAFPGLQIRGNTVVNVGNVAIGCSVCQDVVIEDNTVVHQEPSHGGTLVRVPIRNENSYPSLPQSNNVVVRNNTLMYDSPRPGTGVRLGDGDSSNYTSAGNRTYYAPDADMVSGCETYNSGDSITVSAGTCQNSIPQNLLDAALAKAALPANLPEPSDDTGDTSDDSDDSANNDTPPNLAGGSDSGSASAIGWYHLGLLIMLLGIKWGRALFGPGSYFYGPRSAMKARL